MKYAHNIDGLVDEFLKNNSADVATDEGWNKFNNWLSENKIEIFKCSNCGEKYNTDFCSTNDVSICRWCSGEEN